MKAIFSFLHGRILVCGKGKKNILLGRTMLQDFYTNIKRQKSLRLGDQKFCEK